MKESPRALVITRRFSGGLPPDSGLELPEEFLERAKARLSAIALAYASVYFVQALLGHAVSGGEYLRLATVFVPLVFILPAVALSLAISWRSAPGRWVVVAGLVFEVFGTIGIDVGILFWDGVPFDMMLGISWTAVWIAIYPLIVPSRPSQALLAGLLAAAVAPAFLLVRLAAGAQIPLAVGLPLVVPNFIAAGIAFAGARIIYSLGRDVRKAETVGGYQLVERIGAGGMGEVWKAVHEFLARPAAVKLIRPETLGVADNAGERRLLARFEREAQATAILTSPHTVTVYDYGLTNDGAFYYVMELLEGVDLRSLVETFGPVSTRRAVRILQGICDSLEEAHAHGMVHRDIKPANVFVARVGRRHDFVKVVDFGLVGGAVEGARESATSLDAVTTGTPAFMAPEMLLGEHVDHRADIYGVGCIAFWLLTGRAVFEEDDLMELARAHIHRTPPRASAISEFDIPNALDDLIASCFEKDPDARPDSVRDVAIALSALDTPRWTEHDAGHWWRAHLPELARPRRARPSVESLDAFA